MCPVVCVRRAPGSCGHILHFYTYTQTSRITYTVQPPPHTAQSRHSAARNTWRMPAPPTPKTRKRVSSCKQGNASQEPAAQEASIIAGTHGKNKKVEARVLSGRVARRCGCAGACATAHDSWLCLRAARLSFPLPSHPPSPLSTVGRSFRCRACRRRDAWASCKGCACRSRSRGPE